MKLTPLLLFLLILVVLVIAIITLKNPIKPDEKEGFVKFKTNVVPQTETVVPQYSGRNIVKLYDNLFIDRQNMNIVEVVASKYSGPINIRGNVISNVSAGNVDLVGSSISEINVKTRAGASMNYKVSGTSVVETTESKISGINDTLGSVAMYSSVCSNTARYQLLYVPWGTDTYIHGIQLTAHLDDPLVNSFKPLNLFSGYIPANSSANISVTYYVNDTVDLISSSFIDPSEKYKLVSDSLYSSTRKVFQLIPGVKYDIKSGNLIVGSSGSITVYNRAGTSKTYSSAPSDSELPSSLDNSLTASWIVNNSANDSQIVYIPSSGKTLVLVIQKDDADRFSIISMGRFDKDKEISAGGSGGSSGSDDSRNTSPPLPGTTLDPSAMSEYYKWYWYWNSSGPGTNPKYSDNYMLKTQIVPPVCPSCPSATCASTASNVDASGNTQTGESKSTGPVSNAVDTTGNVINKTVDTAGNVINKTVDTTSNLLTSGATGATNLLTSGATGATNLLTSGATGATNLLTSGATGATNLLTSGASGTVGLLKDAGSGVAGIAGKTLDTTGNIVGSLTSRGNYGGASGESGAGGIDGAGAYYGGLNTPYGSNSGYSAPGFSRGNPPTDNYSYYGALPNKGSNYIPITADFSAFKK